MTENKAQNPAAGSVTLSAQHTYLLDLVREDLAGVVSRVLVSTPRDLVAQLTQPGVIAANALLIHAPGQENLEDIVEFIAEVQAVDNVVVLILDSGESYISVDNSPLARLRSLLLPNGEVTADEREEPSI